MGQISDGTGWQARFLDLVVRLGSWAMLALAVVALAAWLLKANAGDRLLVDQWRDTGGDVHTIGTYRRMYEERPLWSERHSTRLEAFRARFASPIDIQSKE